jgi:hypothetical protein
MGPAGEWDRFQVNLHVQVTDGAAIFAITSLYFYGPQRARLSKSAMCIGQCL